MTLTKMAIRKPKSSAAASKAIASATSPLKRNIKPFRTYEQAVTYLFQSTDYEKQQRLRYNVTTFDLSRMQALLKQLGDPHKKIKCVHIAGTKGKGSTATMLAKMLEANNYKVGLYTSPHVVTIHERIMINSTMIGSKELLDLINRVHPVVERLRKQGSDPTFFEIFTAIAFLYFADQQVDIAVIETGVGGRLDSTNVITPQVVGITSISFDHMNLLGNTLESIAREKAGVIKKGVPVVTVPQEPDALKALKKQATAVKAPLIITGKDVDFSYRFESSREHGPHTRICLTTPFSRFEHLRVPLPGEHQAINCGLALAMLDQLKQQGFVIDDQKAVAGLHTITMPGRMEMICRDPRILVDAAHNAASIKALIQAIGQHIPYDSLIFIFGCNVDKDIRGMLTELQYGADKVIFTRSNSPKAVSPLDLAEMYTEICGKMCQTAFTLSEALRIAKSAITREDLICITGSFYLVGQAKEMFGSVPEAI